MAEEISDVILYEQVFDKKWNKGYTWTQISDSFQWGTNEDTTRKRYNRLCTKLDLPRKPEKPIDEVSMDNDDHIDELIDEISMKIDDTIDELPIDPTMYISDLSNDEWINHYAEGYWEADYLTELRNLIWDSQKGMYQVFRGGGKTFSCVALFARWMLEIRTSVLCFTNAGMKDDIFRAVLEILESEEVQADYGMVVDRNSEHKGVIRLKPQFREGMRYPNFKVIGNYSAAIGWHGGWAHIEDIIQDQAVSVDANLKIRRWFSRVVRFMKKRDTKITITGTRKDPDDWYQYVENEHYFNLVKWEALTLVSGRYPTIEECGIDHENEVITSYPNVGEYSFYNCPEWPLDKLLYEYLFHYDDFEAEMQNNPMPSQGRFFSGDDWVEVEKKQDGTNYMIVDPAKGESSSASKTAIIMMCVGNGKITIIDAYIGKLGIDDKADMIVDFHVRHRPSQTYIEDNFRQVTQQYSLDHPVLNLRGLSMIDNFDKKRHRIEAIKFPYRKREFQILTSCPFKGEIKGEYLTYSQQDSDAKVKTKYNALDAMSMGYLRLKHFLTRKATKITMGTHGNRFR